MASRKYNPTTCRLIWSAGVIFIFLVVQTIFLPLLALPDNVLDITLVNSASCCCRCLIFWSCSSITSAYDGSMLTFLNGLSARYNHPVDVDKCVVVSESFIQLIWFMMSGIAILYVFQKKSEVLYGFCVLICVDPVKLWRCRYCWLGIWPLRQQHDSI